MGIFTDILRSAANGIAKKASEIEERQGQIEERYGQYSNLPDDQVKAKMRDSSTTNRMIAKKVLQERGYHLKNEN